MSIEHEAVIVHGAKIWFRDIPADRLDDLEDTVSNHPELSWYCRNCYCILGYSTEAEEHACKPLDYLNRDPLPTAIQKALKGVPHEIGTYLFVNAL